MNIDEKYIKVFHILLNTINDLGCILTETGADIERKLITGVNDDELYYWSIDAIKTFDKEIVNRTVIRIEDVYKNLCELKDEIEN